MSSFLWHRKYLNKRVFKRSLFPCHSENNRECKWSKHSNASHIRKSHWRLPNARNLSFCICFWICMSNVICWIAFQFIIQNSIGKLSPTQVKYTYKIKPWTLIQVRKKPQHYISVHLLKQKILMIKYMRVPYFTITWSIHNFARHPDRKTKAHVVAWCTRDTVPYIDQKRNFLYGYKNVIFSRFFKTRALLLTPTDNAREYWKVPNERQPMWQDLGALSHTVKSSRMQDLFVNIFCKQLQQL